MDLNHRPLPYQGSALTRLSYRPRSEGDITGSAHAICLSVLVVRQDDFYAARQAYGHVVQEREQGGQGGYQDDLHTRDHGSEAENTRQFQ